MKTDGESLVDRLIELAQDEMRLFMQEHSGVLDKDPKQAKYDLIEARAELIAILSQEADE